MTREKASEWIERLVAHKRDMDKVFSQADELFGLQADSPFGDACWRMVESFIECVAQLIGNHQDSLEWFIWECDCGKKAMQHCLPGGTMRVVATIDDLLDVLGF